MTLIFYVYCSQELYQATDDTYSTLADLQAIFPTSAFLQTQNALLFYHNKGKLAAVLSNLHNANYRQTLSERQESSMRSWPPHHIALTASTTTPTSCMS